MKGQIFFISGPSGVGKGTLISALKDRHPEWVFPPSYSTRPMRENESQGSPYYFVSEEAFDEKIKKDEFLEYAIVHGKDKYGTEKESLMTPAQKGHIVVKEFDVQGFEQIRKTFPKEFYTSLFLNVHGGEEELMRRIEKRQKMDPKEFKKRMESMRRELQMEPLYDYVIYNDNIEEMVFRTEEIIKKECPFLEK